MSDNGVETATDFYIASTESHADCQTCLLVSARVEQVGWM